MAGRRENHVTREMQERLLAAEHRLYQIDPLPRIPKDLAEWLRRNYPQKVYKPLEGETLEQHLIYSGCVMLAEELLEAHEAQDNEEAAAAALLNGEEGEGQAIIINREHEGDT